MIETEEIQKLDLYEHGNYIGSFDSIEKVNEYFKKEIDKLKYYYEINSGDEHELEKIYRMNSRKYSIIRSSHINFKKTLDNKK